MFNPRSYVLLALLAGACVLAVTYALVRTSLYAQTTQYFATHMALSMAVGALVLLVSLAACCVAYGVSIEGKLGRNLKPQKLRR